MGEGPVAYTYTVDERCLDGSVSYIAGDFDAPSYTNATYGVADGEFAFGALDGYDRDVYGLGTLALGIYRFIAENLTWSPGSDDSRNLSSFSLLVV